MKGNNVKLCSFWNLAVADIIIYTDFGLDENHSDGHLFKITEITNRWYGIVGFPSLLAACSLT